MNLQQYWVAMESEQVGQVTLQNVLFLLQKYKTEGLDNTFIMHTLAIWNLKEKQNGFQVWAPWHQFVTILYIPLQ